jgi:quinolinate synthase
MHSAHTLFETLSRIKVGNPLCNYTLEKCERLAPIVNEIFRLKEEKNALILAHSYVHPDIVYSVADHVGDSYGLSLEARKTEREVIVFPSVRFMAETAKILNPSKIVLDPNPNGGCSLAESITANDVLALRDRYPNHTFVCYINTTAEVKALCDVCVTSSNVYKIIELLPNDKIYFLPDKLMGQNIKQALKEKGCDKELLYYDGTCYVHEEYSEKQIDFLKATHPTLKVVAHPECKPEVTCKADHVASTTGMLDYVKKEQDKGSPFLLLTECGIASRLQIECPEAELIGSCTMCRYMRSNSLDRIRQTLSDPKAPQIVEIPQAVIKRAKRSLEAMFYWASK